MNLIPVPIHNLWKKIEQHVKNNVGSSMGFKIENHSPVILGKITAVDRSLLDKSRKILEDELGLTFQRPGKRHGSGNKNIILVQLSSITQTDIDRINKIIDIVPTPKPAVEKTIRTMPVIEIIHETQTEEQPETFQSATTTKKSCRMSISKLIQSIFDFENINDKFRYIKGKKDDICETIEADSVESAEKICTILKWKIGEKFVSQEDKIVIIDCCDFGNNKTEFIFCFPPKINEVNEIERRLRRIWHGSKPFIRFLSVEDNRWEIRYQRKASEVSPKMMQVLLGMGWNVVCGIDRPSIILGMPILSEENVPTQTMPIKIPSETPTTEQASVPTETIKQELRNMLNDSDLEEGTRQEIIAYFHKEEINKRAKFLLAKLQNKS